MSDFTSVICDDCGHKIGTGETFFRMMFVQHHRNEMLARGKHLTKPRTICQICIELYHNNTAPLKEVKSCTSTTTNTPAP